MNRPSDAVVSGALALPLAVALWVAGAWAASWSLDLGIPARWLIWLGVAVSWAFPCIQVAMWLATDEEPEEFAATVFNAGLAVVVWAWLLLVAVVAAGAI